MPLFGRKKKAPVSGESIARLRATMDLLQTRETFLQTRIDKEAADAKRYVSQKNNRQALQCLKRKRAYEAQLDKVGKTRFSIETQTMALEQATVNVEAIHAMKMGSESMRAIQGDMTLEDVDNSMDDITDQLGIAGEISDAISQSVGGDVFDDDDLLAELEGLYGVCGRSACFSK